MSFIVFSSRHKAFKAGPAGGGSALSLPCSGDVPDFIRLNQGSTTSICTLIGFPSPSSTDTAQIGNTKFVSGQLPATLHSANTNLTLSNRGCRARYDYYFWQSNDIWKYDSKIETSGTQDTFSTWEVDATPLAAPVEGTTLGLYPMLVAESGKGRGPLRPKIVTAGFDGASVILVKKDLITGVWTSGNIGTMNNVGNGIVISELFHDNKIYFITDQSNQIAILDAEQETIQELSWPQSVRHPMDLNVFTGKVYCLNKTVSNSGVAIWEVDGATGLSKAIQLDEARGEKMGDNNFEGRNLLFSCYSPGPLGLDEQSRPIPHMVAFQWTQRLAQSGLVVTAVPSGSGVSITSGIQPPGYESPGFDVWAVQPTGNGQLVFPIVEDGGPVSLRTIADEWNYLAQGGVLFRPSIQLAQGRNTEDNIWRCWVDDATNLPSGDPIVNVIFRENPDDGAVYRQYRYRNNPYEDKMSLLGAIQSGSLYTGQHHLSYTTHKVGGGQADATAWKPDITVSGIEITSDGYNRVWFIVDGDFLHPDGKEISVSLMYGGKGDRLSAPNINQGTLAAAGRGSIVNKTNHQTIQDGIPQYIDWNAPEDGFNDGDRVNFALLMLATGDAPSTFQKKMSFVNYINTGGAQFTTSTGPDAHGQFFNVTNVDESSTGPDTPGIFTNVSPAFNASSVGPIGSQIFFNVGFDSSSTGPIASASGIFTFSTPSSGVIQRPVIWWGFRASQRTISGFGRAQGRLR